MRYGYINECGHLISHDFGDTANIPDPEVWKPVADIDLNALEVSDNEHIVVIQPYDAGDTIEYRYVEQWDMDNVNRQIADLKAELGGTDYQVIKCYEASLTGTDMPYDVIPMIANRQALRDKINELEAKLGDA